MALENRQSDVIVFVRRINMHLGSLSYGVIIGILMTMLVSGIMIRRDPRKETTSSNFIKSELTTKIDHSWKVETVFKNTDGTYLAFYTVSDPSNQKFLIVETSKGVTMSPLVNSVTVY